MNRGFIVRRSVMASTVLALLLAFVAVDVAQARRLGGGSSIGRQSGNVMKRAVPAAPASAPAPSSVPVKPAAPAQQAAPASTAPSAAAAPQPQRRGFLGGMGGLLAGVAAGVGLAWLFSSLGMSEAFGQFALIAIVVLLVFMAVRWLMRPRVARNSYAFQGAGSGMGGASVETIPSSYYPEHVGNDASARPWEQGAGAQSTTGREGLVIGSAVQDSVHGSASGNWNIPAGFDVESFLKVAKSNFIHLQAAWDNADMVTLRSMMTDDMLSEINAQLAERERLSGGAPNLTEVQMLQAQLLGIEEVGDEATGEYLASVEFSGMVREDRHSGPSPFREVWNMSKPRNGSRGWLVAGVQALQ